MKPKVEKKYFIEDGKGVYQDVLSIDVRTHLKDRVEDGTVDLLYKDIVKDRINKLFGKDKVIKVEFL